MDRSSKLLSVPSRPPLEAAARVKDDDLDSNPGWILWVVDRRPLLESNRLDRISPGFSDELGWLLDTPALFEVLPFRDNE
uniref:Casein kinase I isoform delta-like protein n=1 Tax=Rhizophora mucronata TaxID=61149 RepID=A0A2P2JVF0_RHIMU